MIRLIKMTVLFSAIALFTGCSGTANVKTPLLQEYNRSAEMALARGDIDQANLELKLALQKNPLDSKAHYMLGSLLAWQGVEDQAIIGFKRAIMIDPTHPEALYNLGTLLLRRGETISAAELFEAAVTYNPDYIPPYNNLAKAYYLVGLPELAIDTYKEVLRRDVANSIASQNLALLVAAAKPKPKETGGVKQKPKPGEGPAILPTSLEKRKEITATPKQPHPKKDTAPEISLPNLDGFRKLLRGLPYVSVEEQAGVLALTGWTRDKRERTILDRFLAKWPKVLDLTGVDTGDPQRMVEVDVVLFVVIGLDNTSIGFNFLQQISLSATYFTNSNARTKDVDGDWKGLLSPATVGNLVRLPSWGSLLVASVDYDVNIANAVEERIAVLARPHLTTLSGTPASFLAGGEWVFRVSGLETGNIKPYPFGTSVTVTPTLLRTPGKDNEPRVHLDIIAKRTSVLEVLTAIANDEDVVFDQLSVNSHAVLHLGQTLILSGLNQREARTSDSGVPILKDIPLLKYVFSQTSTVETNTAIIILLTPRDPAFRDEQNRRALSAFVEQRRAFLKASQGTEKDMLKYRERYPNWQALPPNRFSSHFFLMQNSDLYRNVSGEDLIDEDLDLHLLENFDLKKKKDKNVNEKNNVNNYLNVR